MKLFKRVLFIFCFLSLVSGMDFLLFASAVNAAEKPKRIISLAPSITEYLYALGVQDNLIGVTTYCDYPKDAKNRTKIGTLINPNVEKILSLCPDLILTVKDINRPHSIEKLKDLGLEVIALKECETFDDIVSNLLQLSKIVGKEEKAEEIIEKAKRKMKELTDDINDTLPKSVFWQVNAKPLVTAGRSTFVNNIIRLAGGINIFAEIDSKYPRLNCEEVILRNPEVIILVTMGDVTPAQRLFWQKFKQIDAVRNNRIYVVDANLVCRPTILHFLEGLETIKNILHPTINFSKSESNE
ncbi:MAG: cobalamin-binding protein [Candidatus Omnitrophota bacterium]|nr:MAG: cobalamin-binding protein [Candidatus Omnitrophota bacterium]